MNNSLESRQLEGELINAGRQVSETIVTFAVGAFDNLRQLKGRTRGRDCDTRDSAAALIGGPTFNRAGADCLLRRSGQTQACDERTTDADANRTTEEPHTHTNSNSVI